MKNELELRMFLLDRVKDDYVFPFNPVWPVRDRGWHQVFQAMRDNPKTAELMAAWDPVGAGIYDTIDEIHQSCPQGFVINGQEAEGEAVNSWQLPMNSRQAAKIRKTETEALNVGSEDIQGSEKADLAFLAIKKARIGVIQKAVNKARAVAAPTTAKIKQAVQVTKIDTTKIDTSASLQHPTLQVAKGPQAPQAMRPTIAEEVQDLTKYASPSKKEALAKADS
jgi:hypothetical protein